MGSLLTPWSGKGRWGQGGLIAYSDDDRDAAAAPAAGRPEPLPPGSSSAGISPTCGIGGWRWSPCGERACRAVLSVPSSLRRCTARACCPKSKQNGYAARQRQGKDKLLTGIRRDLFGVNCSGSRTSYLLVCRGITTVARSVGPCGAAWNAIMDSVRERAWRQGKQTTMTLSLSVTELEPCLPINCALSFANLTKDFCFPKAQMDFVPAGMRACSPIF